MPLSTERSGQHGLPLLQPPRRSKSAAAGTARRAHRDALHEAPLDAHGQGGEGGGAGAARARQPQVHLWCSGGVGRGRGKARFRGGGRTWSTRSTSAATQRSVAVNAASGRLLHGGGNGRCPARQAASVQDGGGGAMTRGGGHSPRGRRFQRIPRCRRRPSGTAAPARGGWRQGVHGASAAGRLRDGSCRSERSARPRPRPPKRPPQQHPPRRAPAPRSPQSVPAYQWPPPGTPAGVPRRLRVGHRAAA